MELRFTISASLGNRHFRASRTLMRTGDCQVQDFTTRDSWDCPGLVALSGDSGLGNQWLDGMGVFVEEHI